MKVAEEGLGILIELNPLMALLDREKIPKWWKELN